jgi:integral membrane protein
MSSTQADPRARSARRPVGRGVLVRYRILAYTTAVFLLVLVFVAIPIQIWGHNDTMVAIVGQIHGFLYIVYLVVAFEITVKLRIPLVKMVLVLLAGTIPFGAFVAERKITQAWEQRRLATGKPAPARQVATPRS